MAEGWKDVRLRLDALREATSAQNAVLAELRVKSDYISATLEEARAELAASQKDLRSHADRPVHAMLDMSEKIGVLWDWKNQVNGSLRTIRIMQVVLVVVVAVIEIASKVRLG